MNDSWFFSENFGELPDDFFDEEFDNGEQGDLLGDWDAKLQHLEVPPTNILTSVPFVTDGESSKVNQSYSVVDNKSPQLKEQSSEAKYLHLSWTSSPVSVLESSTSSCSGDISALHNTVSVKRPRSKHPRPMRQSFPFIASLIADKFSHHSGTLRLESEPYIEANNADSRKQIKKRNLKQLSQNQEMKTAAQHPVEIRKCTHCEVTETPQWREGPLGPKTLCNACGVRYRSGRLLPEYRPAASPTFVPSLHSNSHRKVLEMRKQAKGSTPIVS